MFWLKDSLSSNCNYILLFPLKFLSLESADITCSCLTTNNPFVFFHPECKIPSCCARICCWNYKKGDVGKFHMGSNLKTFMAAARFIKRRKKAKVTKRDANVKLTRDTFWRRDPSTDTLFSAPCQVTEPLVPRLRPLSAELIS